MKKNVIALLLAVVMVSGNVGTVPALAAEATTQEAVAVEEETVEDEEEAPAETEDAGTGEVSEGTTETESVDETDEVPEQELAEEADTTEEADSTEEADTTEDTEEEDSAVPADTSAEMTEEEELSVIAEVGSTEVEAKEAALAEGDIVDSGTCGEHISWILDNNGILTISGTGEMSDYGDGAGTGSLSPWSNYNFMIDKVIVEKGVTSIGRYAFCASAVKDVMLPNTVEEIGESSFAATSELTSVTLPEGVKRIYNEAFRGSGLVSITVPASVEVLGTCLFEHCDNLETVDFKNTLNEIPYGTFWGCSHFTEYSIPDSVTSIGRYAFGWSGIESIQIPSSVETIGEQAFDDCNSLETVSISEGVKTIKGGAFYGCDNLKELNLPESIQSLQGDNIFGESPQLVITVVEGSYAARYVAAMGFEYRVICKIHVWNGEYTVDKEATCTEEGSESIHCSVCDAINEPTVRAIPKKDHAYSDWTITMEATCTEVGFKEKVCTVCGDKVTEEIPATGHKWNEEYTVDKEATCTEEGAESIHCSVCGFIDESTIRVIEKKEHVYGDWTVTKETTCTETGSREKVCADCGDKVVEVISATGHVWNEEYTVDKEATCTEEGAESIHCSVCDSIDESSVRTIEKKEHTYGDWTVTKEATCTKAGSKEKICADCGDKAFEEIPATGHIWNEYYTVDKEATCTEEGAESIHCSVCGETKDGSEHSIEKTEHTYGNWKITTSPTCTEVGIQKKVCTACGDTVTEEVPAIGHLWNSSYTTDKEPTYTEEGSKSIHCSVCGEIKEGTQRPIAKLQKPVSMLTISGITAKTYTGKAQTQAVVVKDGTTTLAKGTDYTLTYKNNTNAGTASVTIKGTGNYTGSVTKTFTIKKAANAVTAKNFVKTYSAAAQTFALGATAKGGTLTYASSSGSVTVTKAGKVTVKAKFIGKATITITAQNANYNKATKKITITVNPTKTGISSVTSPAAGQMLVKWKKNAVGTGYQIQYSTSSKFTGAKSAWTQKNTVVSKKITSLTKGKKYYVRMRTYKTVGGVKYYSGWCTVKAVTIKK